jgi:hypothetical protein
MYRAECHQVGGYSGMLKGLIGWSDQLLLHRESSAEPGIHACK